MQITFGPLLGSVQGAAEVIEFVIAIVVTLGYLALVIYSCRWAARDASKRGKSGFLIGLLAFLTWPIGLLFWVIARPEPPTDIGMQAGDASKPKPCVYPECKALAWQTGRILGKAIYRCKVGHEFTDTAENGTAK
jgi:hypothetical protein